MKRTYLFGFIAAVLLFTVAGFAWFWQIQNPIPASEGKYVATDYNYGGQGGVPALRVDTGPSGTGSQTYTVRVNAFIAVNRSGRIFMPLATNAPIFLDSEGPLTPSAVSCATPTQGGTCTFTITVVNAHGPGSLISSATFGLQEAINDAGQSGGALALIDPMWKAYGGTDALVAAAVPYGTVSIEDRRNGVVFWSPNQTTATVLAAPATLTATTVGFGLNGANTTGGTYTGANTYVYDCAYVDIMGNEGPASATFSAATAGTGTTNQIGFAAPAASTGAVGYVCYISLSGGSYNLSYQVPLVDGTTCTLTKLERTTPACAVANSTYSQSASNLIVSALTVNTAPLHLLATTASTTAAYIGSPSGRTTYAYAPHNVGGTFGLTSSQQAYAITVAPATTVPTVLGTIPIPPGFMNQVGRAIKVCGEATNAGTNSATVENIELLWDAAGSNTAGAPVIVGQMQITVTQAGTAENYSFCETLQTTVSGAGVTAGSLQPVFGNFTLSEAAGTLHAAGPDVKAAAVGSLNLAGTGGNTQRIHVVYLHTTGTDGAGTTLQGLTVELI